MVRGSERLLEMTEKLDMGYCFTCYQDKKPDGRILPILLFFKKNKKRSPVVFKFLSNSCPLISRISDKKSRYTSIVRYNI